MSDPVKYNKYKIIDAINHRKHRKSMDDIQRKIYNQKTVMRMRKHREREKDTYVPHNDTPEVSQSDTLEDPKSDTPEVSQSDTLEVLQSDTLHVP